MSQDTIIGLDSPEKAIPRPAPTGLEDLITTYHDLNPTTIDELPSDPSPLEFLRYVSQNRPFVIRRGASTWPACQKWSAPHLLSILGPHPVNLATTPHGNADSILPTPHLGPGTALFVKPHEHPVPFSTALSQIQTQELRPDEFAGATPYAQTQNDNLRNEYGTLFGDVPESVPFARIALQKEPDAVNFWLGNSRSVTALHKDNYENVYVQVLGRKHFVLLPPVEAPCVNERAVLAATYVPSDGEGEGGLVAKVDDPEEYVPFAMWDPDRPEENATRFSQYSQPLRVTLDEGDMLYLPALWYHKVSQSCSEEGICCAVNYWYDLDFSGGFWSMSTFIRGVGLLALQDTKEEGKEKEKRKGDQEPGQGESVS
ncbi:Clavaminate synthase-like protein [Corynespora cassiicola Philippines]|uniref:Clavaminate synthase-like protein n=1 Tax=Corynespora cassiicola Philippines TaxID=1448308 RepID=A0A2T2NLC4_CORCC|nr:Clavaminate synthase-like protein [Corynespora cassiicola Philippines]